MQNHINAIVAEIEKMPRDEKIAALNHVRAALHEISPFKDHPTDFTKWVKAEKVISNDYNPNKVARPEMLLLEDSIKADGVTMNIVVFPDHDQDLEVVVDGFHRWTVLTKRMHFDYVPVSEINKPQADRMASTVRHNRARGKHQVDLMTDMVEKLLSLGWSESKIAKHLGMEAEEVLRLKREAGIGAYYAKQPHSKAWVRDTDDVVMTHG